MYMSRKVKSVSFNINDPFEIEMFEYANKFPNFSSFIKRLIQNAMNGKSENIQLNQHVQKVEKSPIINMEINPEHLKQLI
jgi:hypothetical protein